MGANRIKAFFTISYNTVKKVIIYMLNWTLLQNLLIIATACSSITVIFIQKTKKFCKSSYCITTYGLFVNLILGFFFSQTFSDIDYVKSVWVGLFSFLGADTIYKNLEGKIASYKELTIHKKKKNVIEKEVEII